MKRPTKIVKWFTIQERKTEFVDWNGKPAKEYVIVLPYWLGRAFTRARLPYAKVTLFDKSYSMKDMDKQSTKKVFWKYFKSNFSRKCDRMRKLNNNYMNIEIIKQSYKK